jgi:hypothetical protein
VAASDKQADNHPDAAQWDDPARHRQLLEELVAGFDGWAIATTPDGIAAYGELPPECRLMAWVKPNAQPGAHRLHGKWEAVIVYPPPGRRSNRNGAGSVPNVLTAEAPRVGFTGAKPAEWTRWVLDALGYDPATDEVTDLFHGSGLVAAAVDEHKGAAVASIPIPEETRRDQWGRYLVVPPIGGKPLGYTRATTVAKTLDAEGGLANWMTTMAIVGLMTRKGLRAQWEALIAETQGDPWYNSPASKAQAKALVEECKEAGGSRDRAKIGEALHTITAAVDAGKDIGPVSDVTAADLSAYLGGMTEAGVQVLPEYIEQTCVLDDWQVAGTFDRIAIVQGVPMIADLKTGTTLDYSWLQIAVQLAIYAHADALYHQGSARNGSQDKRLPMPAVDQARALVMHLPAGEGRLDLYLVDIARGWEAFEHSMWTRGWRASADGIAAPLVPADQLTQQLELSLHQVLHPEPAPPQPAPDPEFLRDLLQQRVDVIGADPVARQDLVAYWPPGLPSVRQAQPADFQAISAVLDGVEKRCSIPFPEMLGLLLELFPNTTIINKEFPS